MYCIAIILIAFVSTTTFALNDGKFRELLPVRGYALFQKIDLSSSNGVKTIVSNISPDNLLTTKNTSGQTFLQASVLHQYDTLSSPRDFSDAKKLIHFATQAEIGGLIVDRMPFVSDEDMKDIIARRKSIFVDEQRMSYERSKSAATRLLLAAVVVSPERDSSKNAKAIEENLSLLATSIGLCCDPYAVLDALMALHDEKRFNDEQFLHFVSLLTDLFPPDALPSKKDLATVVEKLHAHGERHGVNCNASLVKFLSYVDQNRFLNPRRSVSKALQSLDELAIKAELQRVTLAEAIYAIDSIFNERISMQRIVDFVDNPGEIKNRDVRAYLNFSQELIAFVRASVKHTHDSARMYKFWLGVYHALADLDDINGAFCIAYALNQVHSHHVLQKHKKIPLARRRNAYATYHEELHLRLLERDRNGRRFIPSIILAHKFARILQDTNALLTDERLKREVLWDVQVTQAAFYDSGESRHPSVELESIPHLASLLMHLPERDHEKFADVVKLINPPKKRLARLSRHLERS